MKIIFDKKSSPVRASGMVDGQRFVFRFNGTHLLFTVKEKDGPAGLITREIREPYRGKNWNPSRYGIPRGAGGPEPEEMIAWCTAAAKKWQNSRP